MDSFSQLVAAQKAQQYVILVCITLLAADVVHTLPEEISLIWMAVWKLGKVLFLFTRYFFFVYAAMNLWLSVGSTSTICSRVFIAASCFQTCVMTAEAILFLRVYALSNKSPAYGIALAILYVGVQSGVIVATAEFARSVHFDAPVPGLIGCIPVKSTPSNLSTIFGLTLCSEVVILVVTLYLGYTKHRNLKTPFIIIFYRDGLVYFVLLSAISTANIICDQVAPIGYNYVLVVPQAVAHALLSTRMVLHMRRISRASRGAGTEASDIDIPLSAIKYAQPETPVGTHTYD